MGEGPSGDEATAPRAAGVVGAGDVGAADLRAGAESPRLLIAGTGFMVVAFAGVFQMAVSHDAPAIVSRISPVVAVGFMLAARGVTKRSITVLVSVFLAFLIGGISAGLSELAFGVMPWMAAAVVAASTSVCGLALLSTGYRKH